MSSAPRRGQREPTPTRHVQTLAAAYSAICSGMPPWVALNEFFHEWFDYSSDQRDRLVADPIPCTRYSARHIRHTQRVSNQTDALDQWRWAVFCVGAADYLCQHFDVPRPAWLDDPRVLLSEPWYGCGDPGATHPDVRAHLEGTTPEPLRRRNVLSGERVFANKYVATHASVPAQRVSPSGQDDAD